MKKNLKPCQEKKRTFHLHPRAAQYTAHFLLHKLGFLWKFHVVHHSDKNVDATTGTRIHPGDYVFREMLAAGAVVVFGIPIAFYLLYRTVTVVFT